MRHVTTENLIAYMDGQASDVEKLTLQSHLTSCGECGKIMQEFQSLMTCIQEDSAYEPPVELVQRGVRLFQPSVQPQAGAGLRMIIASLVFDAYDKPIL